MTVPSVPWVRARAAVAAAAGGAALVLLGVAAGRADVAVIGVAPLVAALWDWSRRPRGAVGIALAQPVEQPEPGQMVVHATVDAPADAPAALLAVRRGRTPAVVTLVRLEDGHRAVRVRVRTVRTGPQELATAEALALGEGGGSIAEAADPVDVRTVVLPGTPRLGEVPLPPRLRGLSGAHESRRAGEGGGLRDVHPYTSGDRMRRIDWRTTARRSPQLRELYVRREHALAEAAVVLVVDSRDDVGPDPLTWRGSNLPDPLEATSLDLARTAAAALAQTYLGQGDRVGLDDLGVRRRPLPPGAGRRQLDRVRHALAVTEPGVDQQVRARAPQLPSGALVVLFSTFLDDEPVEVAAHWQRVGHRVVVVDVLPDLRTRHLDGRERLALRLVSLAREDRLAALADLGVDLVTWREAPSAALALARRRGAPGRRTFASAVPR